MILLPFRKLPLKKVSLFLFAAFSLTKLSAQTLNGMSTGNYAGITGLSFNPASIVDSRYKFDLNIASAQYFFANNYFDANPLLFARRYLQKEPYNGSFADVKKDLISPQVPPPDGVVRARMNTEFLLPLSFMLTTGKRSAIALTLRNRFEQIVDNLNPQTATLFYEELNDPKLHGIAMNNNGFTQNFNNWQEIGFTYGRVLFNANRHFLKAAITAKWLGGNAASYIHADSLSVTFHDKQTMSMTSPNLQYARTIRADFDLFDRRGLFTDLESQSLGYDIGLVYEYRGRIGNFQYKNENLENLVRRDKNKYTFRLGAALNDLGILTYDRLPLTRDHRANISNWNFSGVKANNIREWDTAYSKQVEYLPGADSVFTIALPTALLLHLDLHLFGGFYINAAMQQPMSNKFFRNATTHMHAGKWFAVTPRFETRFFGVYVPLLIRENNIAQIGATVRFGPVFAGSNNFLALLQNPQVPTSDVHAGVRIPLAFGKPSKIARLIDKNATMTSKLSDEFDEKLETQKTKQSELETRLAIMEKMMDSAYRQPPVVIVNNYINDTLVRNVVTSGDAAPRQGRSAATQERKSTTTTTPTYTPEQQEAMAAEERAMREQAKENLKKQGISEPKQKKTKTKPTKNERRAEKRAKQQDKRNKRYVKDNQRYNEAIERELRMMRRQQAVLGTAMTGAVVANTVVSASGNEGNTVTDTLVVKDTVTLEKAIPDTVYIRDTIIIEPPQTPVDTIGKESTGKTPALPELGTESIYFASGSTTIGRSYTETLNKVAAWMLVNPDKQVLLTGVTDATGSPEMNRKLALQRIAVVKNALISRGIDDKRFKLESQVSNKFTTKADPKNRRVDISAIE
jgi:outer membrane protein OmpA-like peptidoglycan-associated protein